MTPKVEFHFDFGSPNAYFAHKVIPAIEQRTGAKFAYVPILLGGVFKLTNNQPPMVAVQGRQEQAATTCASRSALHREARADQVQDEPATSRSTPCRSCAARWRPRWTGSSPKYADAVFRHMWEDGQEDGRSRGHPRRARCRRARRRPHAGAHPGAGRQGQAAARTPKPRSRAAPSARRRSSSAARSSSARTGCATWRRRSWRRRRGADCREGCGNRAAMC